MLDLVPGVKEVDRGRRGPGLPEIVDPLEAVLPPGRRLQLDAVLLREAGREDEGRGGVVAEPVRARLVGLVAVYPDHDVAEAQDLR